MQPLLDAAQIGIAAHGFDAGDQMLFLFARELHDADIGAVRPFAPLRQQFVALAVAGAGRAFLTEREGWRSRHGNRLVRFKEVTRYGINFPFRFIW
jgi:hypothetical protein